MPTRAADTQGQFALKGAGATSCSDFVAAAGEGGTALAQYFGYVAGYTSAFNELQPNTFDAWSWQSADTVLLLLRERCLRQPQLRFGAALATLTHYWFAERVTARAELVALGGPDNTLVYASTLARIRDKLRALGYTVTDTYTALMRYKADREIQDSPNHMQMLLLRLLTETTEAGQ